MQTQCPYCQTIFRITEAHLNLAQGHVRCGQCRNVFDAANSMVKPQANQEATLAPGRQLDTTVAPAIDFSEVDFPEIFQEDIDALRYRTSWSSLLWWAVIALLMAALLVGQATWFWQRDLILQHPELRPWLERFCYTFLCTLPLTRAVESFQVQEGPVVQVHPERGDAIKVDAVFINNAIFVQPYPDVQLTFQDNSGLQIAQRRFKPSEYLHTSEINKVMKPGATAHINLELKVEEEVIADGKVVVGYTLEFF
jgi:predicted Zn finger-like uncharacterized protein